MWQQPNQPRRNPRHVRYAGRGKMRTPTAQQLLLGQSGRTRLLPLTAWPPPYQAGDERHSDSWNIEKAYCLSLYEGLPERNPVLAGLSPHENLHRNVSVPGTPCSRTHMAGI